MVGRMSPHFRAGAAQGSRSRVRCPHSTAYLFLLRGVLACFLALALSGCGLAGKSGVQDDPRAASSAAPSVAADDAWQGDPVPYAVALEAGGGHKDLLEQMRSVSQLVRLEHEPPDSLLALERRARADVETAVRLMHSLSWYDGTASFRMDEEARPVQVTLGLVPGERYSLGSAHVVYDPAPVIPPAFANRTRAAGFWGLDAEPVPPPSFPDVLPGVAVGSPVIAQDMLAAVEALPQSLRRQGYPLAAATDSRYVLNREARTLHATIRIDPGPPAAPGPVEVRGARKVDPAYLQRLTPWATGREPWNADAVEDYAAHLRTLGLFRTVEVRPLEENLVPAAGENGIAVLPLEVTVAEAPFRSVGGSARYDTDTGFGLEGFWEHRNLLGSGEKLTLAAPVATQVQGLRAAFEKPAFLVRDQRLLAAAFALREDTEAYKKTAAGASTDVERRLSRHWWGSLGLKGESGSISDTVRGTQEFGFFAPRLGLRRDTRDNMLNSADGSDIRLELAPHAGTYGSPFTALGATLSASGYYAPLRKGGRPDDRLVLAGRVEVGSMAGASLRTLPPTMRYYKGGAGSVRGYVHQSLGPRDSDGDPLGGRSFQTVNLEARYKITDSVGIVPFLDGGMVYRDEFPRISGDMRWGTGIGLRYYTPIGPVRLDVGFPLQPIGGDPPAQIYISIGQAF